MGAAATAARAGRFGRFGGRYVPETLMPALEALERGWAGARGDRGFQARLDDLLRTYVGRPTPLYRARRLEAAAGGARIYLKREDLCHTGSHKLNNALGQALLARRLGRSRLIAETGAGQHGVAAATAAAALGLPCRVYMGRADMARQAPNVARMRLLGAEVVAVDAGAGTLKDATNAAIREWMGTYRETHYIIGSAVGPHPYPSMVADFQRVIGVEARAQVLEAEARLPATLVACVGGGSNAIGFFAPFLDDDVALVGVEAGGTGADPGQHAATCSRGRPGVLHGALSYLLQDDDGQVSPSRSIAAGLDYPGVGPVHAWLRDTGRARYVAVDDATATAAFQALSRLEGIIPAMESAHAVARALDEAGAADSEQVILVCLSGRGDKDLGRELSP